MPVINELMWFISGNYTFLPLLVYIIALKSGIPDKIKPYFTIYTISALILNLILSILVVRNKLLVYLFQALLPLIYLFIANWKSTAVLLLFAILLIVLADRISVLAFKETVMRYRPSHNLDLANQLSFLNNYRGGKYGFVSSHAANTLAIATFFSLTIRRKSISILLFSWTFLVCISRIYLGVHYPSDVFCGGLLGIAIGILVYTLYKKFERRVFSS